MSCLLGCKGERGGLYSVLEADGDAKAVVRGKHRAQQSEWRASRDAVREYQNGDVPDGSASAVQVPKRSCP